MLAPGNSLKEEKKPEISTQRGDATEAARKNVKASVSNEKDPNKPAQSGNVQVAAPSPPDTPKPVAPTTDESEPQRTNPSRRRMNGASVRNFPDGTQIVTSPDGTRVVTFPDGTSRVYRPGEKIIRRRKLP